MFQLCPLLLEQARINILSSAVGDAQWRGKDNSITSLSVVSCKKPQRTENEALEEFNALFK